jgi:DNA-binding transcriptional regulator YbjK
LGAVPAADALTPKGQRRRQELLGAAAELAAERGFAAVTHRAVAERAGVSPASTTYYFPTIGDLVATSLAELQAFLAAEIEASVQRSLADGTAPADLIDRFATALVELGGNVVLAQYEIYLNGRRDATLRDSAAAALGGFTRAATTLLEAFGAPDPEPYARAMVGVVDGLMLHHLARPTPDDLAMLEHAIRAVAIAALMTEDEHARWDARLKAPMGEHDRTPARRR